MNHLTKYKLFESVERDLLVEISDIFQDITDEQYRVQINKRESYNGVSVLLTNYYESRHTTIDGLKIIDSISHLINYINSINIYYMEIYFELILPNQSKRHKPISIDINKFVDNCKSGLYPTINWVEILVKEKMKHLKEYKIFEKFDEDDSESLARFQIFESNAIMAFGFNNQLITNRKDIKTLIEKYNQTYNDSKEWGGGPVNREFISYYSNHSFITLDGDQSNIKKVDRSAWKPLLYLIIDIPEFGEFKIGYSITSRKCMTSGSWVDEDRELENDDINLNVDLGMQDSINWYIKENIYDKNLTIDETIEKLSLNIPNKIDWIWKEK